MLSNWLRNLLGTLWPTQKKNPKEEYKVVLTRSKRKKSLEKKERVEGVVKDVSVEEVKDEIKNKEVENKNKK